MFSPCQPHPPHMAPTMDQWSSWSRILLRPMDLWSSSQSHSEWGEQLGGGRTDWALTTWMQWEAIGSGGGALSLETLCWKYIVWPESEIHVHLLIDGGSEVQGEEGEGTKMKVNKVFDLHLCGLTDLWTAPFSHTPAPHQLSSFQKTEVGKGKSVTLLDGYWGLLVLQCYLLVWLVVLF